MPDDMASNGGAPAPSAAPASPPGGGAATGIVPASTPSPNRGLEAHALARLAVLVQGMSMLTAIFPVGSDIARDLRSALDKVAKHVPPGAISQGVQMTEAQRNLMQQRQQAPQIAAMRAAQMGGGGQPPQSQGPPAPPMVA